MDRKKFFETAFRFSSSVISRSKVFQNIEKVVHELETPHKKKERPPGEHLEFLKRCTGCDACMAACPVNVIMIEDLEKRHPVIYPEENPCVHCEGYPCIQSCETGALTLPVSP